MSTMKALLYLHGFRSSPRSFKARLLAARLQALGLGAHWHCPQLPPSPQAAVQVAGDWVAARPRDAQGVPQAVVIGSSLGGFYATVLAERWGCQAVLLNPAVDPARDLLPQVGMQPFYHAPEQSFEFRRGYIDELAALRPAQITEPQRYLLLAATGDEVLDYREMLARYAGCRLRLIEGSDHGLSDFAQYLDEVLAFCGIVTGAGRP
jgi:predicted esterase YcpF (UPF0227 family)